MRCQYWNGRPNYQCKRLAEWRLYSMSGNYVGMVCETHKSQVVGIANAKRIKHRNEAKEQGK